MARFRAQALSQISGTMADWGKGIFKLGCNKSSWGVFRGPWPFLSSSVTFFSKFSDFSNFSPAGTHPG